MQNSLNKNVANVELELSGNVTAIQKNVTKQINEVYVELDNNYTEVQDEISMLQNDIEQLHNSPIGNLHIYNRYCSGFILYVHIV